MAAAVATTMTRMTAVMISVRTTALEDDDKEADNNNNNYRDDDDGEDDDCFDKGTVPP